MDDIEASLELDCRGLNCPLPVLKTRKAIDGLASGQVLRMTATDPASMKDIGAWCRATGHELLESERDRGEFRFRIRKK